MRLTGFQDKRTYLRFPFKEPIQVSLEYPTHFNGSLSCDLSEGGARIYLNDFIALNTRVVLQIQFPNECLECVGRISWIEQLPYSERFQAGIEFVKNDAYINLQNRIKIGTDSLLSK